MIFWYLIQLIKPRKSPLASARKRNNALGTPKWETRKDLSSKFNVFGMPYIRGCWIGIWKKGRNREVKVEKREGNC